MSDVVWEDDCSADQPQVRECAAERSGHLSGGKTALRIIQDEEMWTVIDWGIFLCEKQQKRAESRQELFVCRGREDSVKGIVQDF